MEKRNTTNVDLLYGNESIDHDSVDSPKGFMDEGVGYRGDILLTDKFAKMETPKGFRDHIELYPHQKTVLHALLDIENKRAKKVDITHDNISNTSAVVETSAVVLSEPFGSGKTIEILALILAKPVPIAYPTHSNGPLTRSELNSVYRTNRAPLLFTTEITRTFAGSNSMIRPNLIVVGSSVLTQWETAIKEFTYLKYFIIGDYYKLREFYKLFQLGGINAYDVILLKNGNVTGNFILPGEEPDQFPSGRPLITVINKICAQYCWSRVIYDDFDTITINPGAVAINTLFTIYVSATNKRSGFYCKKSHTEFETVMDAIRCEGNRIIDATRDSVLFKYFNVRNTTRYVELSTSIPIVNGHKYVYANPDDNYMRLLGAMVDPEADEIMEMLNGDAIATAAGVLGIKTQSVADIFQKMLDKKYKAYIKDQKILEILAILIKKVEALDADPEGEVHSRACLDKYRAKVIRYETPDLLYHSIQLERFVDDMIAEFELAKEQDGLAINRVIDNIKEGECQVCKIDLEDFDTFIVRCCGLIVCDECGIKGNQIQKRRVGGGCAIYGYCANCKARVNPREDLIFVDQSFNIETLLTARGDEDEPMTDEEVEEQIEEPHEIMPEIKNPKLKALLAIVRGRRPENHSHAEIRIEHLLTGRVDNPPVDGVPPKVVVFAGFNETLTLVEDFLKEYEIGFLRLGGTFREKANTIEKFKSDGTVLLINSQQNCAGLNIQFMTDLVFFHKIMDPAVEAQVAGRGQRIGRTCNLQIHYLAYDNEHRRY